MSSLYRQGIRTRIVAGIIFQVPIHLTFPDFRTEWMTKTALHPPWNGFLLVVPPRGFELPVLALKGLRPSPLDDGGIDFLSAHTYIAYC